MMLKDCCAFQEGYVNPSQKVSAYFGGDIKWLRASDLNGGFVYDTERKLSKAGFRSAGKSATMFPVDSLAVSKSGTIGVLGILKSEMCGNRAVINIQVDREKASLHYVFYSLKNSTELLLGKTGGSIQKNLYVSALETVPLSHDNLDEQTRIARVLAAIDAKIDLNNRINAELEALAKTIYDYWFVQFDFPDANGRPYKTSGGKMVWDDTFKREIPDGWEVVTIGQECETILGGTPDTKNPEYWDNADIPWLSSGETASFPVVTSEQSITAAGIRDSAAKVMPAGTVVVSIVRYIRPSILGIAAATNQSVAGILEAAQFPSSYLYPAVCREVPRWMGLRTGAQQPHINKATIDDTLLVKPSPRVVEAYRKVADPLFNRIRVAANENCELTRLRDWLLPLLMNGQVRVT